MNIADLSIRRPVFATMVIAAIVLFGAVYYGRLNVDMYPEVNFPMVTVTTVYAGASPDTMANQVSDPLEEALNSLGGVRTLRSTNLESVSQIFLEFDLSMDVGVATQEVRDRVSTVQGTLPDGATTPTVQKLDLGAAPVLQLAVYGAADEASLLAYAEDSLKPNLDRIDGVGQVDVIGGRDREMHVWLRPEALRGYGLTVADVVQSLRAQNMELPGGRVESGGLELALRTDAQVRNAADLGALALATRGGAVIELADVADIEDGFEEQRSLAAVDGIPAIALVIRKQSDANTVQVAEALEEALPRLRKRAPEGTRIDVLVDNSKSIKGSIETVQLDIVLGGFLAIAIILLFLRDWRATLISAVALPTSVIGTFAFVSVMGFTLNMMTTLALSLSIGILIDDAIVVIENIVRRRTVLGEGPMEAASRGTTEIMLAVLATTLSLVAVFVPVAFMDGMLGQFFYEFGVTVAFAVLLSLFVSFTLTPMLSSRFLTVHDDTSTGLSGAIEAVLRSVEQAYRRIIRWALTNRWKTLGIAGLALGATAAMTPFLGFEFTPVSDTGQFSVALELPPGTPMTETASRAEGVAEALSGIPGVESTFLTVGGGATEQVNTAQVIATLVPRDERAFHLDEAMSYTRALLADEANMVVSVGPLQSLGGGGRSSAVQLDLRGQDVEELAATAERVRTRLSQTPGFVDVDTSVRAGKPELRVEVSRARAADFGVTGAQIATTVRSLVAGEVATQVEQRGERYDVRVQLPLDSAEPSAATPQLRGATGELIDVTSVVDIVPASGPSQIDRQARQLQVSVYASLEGLALSDASDIAERIALEEAPDGVIVEFGGSAKMLQESLASMGLAMFLAIACIYMILASQFESFIHPLTIMISLPFALIGAIGALLLSGESMSIFAMIGLIMLLGLVTKNAILFVDFAIQRRKEGVEMLAALEEAGATRLRPILMTTAAMVFGMLPVAIGHGDGGELRRAMGMVIIGGLISSTVLTLVVVPVVYTIMEGLDVRLRRLGSWTPAASIGGAPLVADHRGAGSGV